MFGEGDARETEKVVLEIVQVPGDRLAVETGDGIANVVIQIAAGFDLKAREHGDHFAIGFDNLRSDVFTGAIFGEEFEERGVAEVFLEIGAVGEIFGVNFRDGKAVTAKMFGEFKEGGVFFADTVENADGVVFLIGEPDDFAAGTAEFALERDDALGRCVKMLFEELLENVHSVEFRHSAAMNCWD
jgi:hypothetical protein